jgi:hypothetical protein
MDNIDPISELASLGAEIISASTEILQVMSAYESHGILVDRVRLERLADDRSQTDPTVRRGCPRAKTVDLLEHAILEELKIVSPRSLRQCRTPAVGGQA